jgi:hypothetical protein
MDSTFELNCSIRGDDPNSVFPVKIAGNESVGTLKKAIREENQETFQGIDARSLKLRKVSEL